jgi:hypothetical protein
MQPGEKPASVPIQSVTIQQPQQDQVVTPNVVHVQTTMTNNMATASLACGVISFFLFGLAIMADEFDLCLWIWIVGLLAVIFGHIGVKEASKTGIGKGQAVTGLLLGYMSLMVYVGGIVFVLLLLQSLGF